VRLARRREWKSFIGGAPMITPGADVVPETADAASRTIRKLADAGLRYAFLFLAR
jgi:hypothetical protein